LVLPHTGHGGTMFSLYDKKSPGELNVKDLL